MSAARPWQLRNRRLLMVTAKGAVPIFVKFLNAAGQVWQAYRRAWTGEGWPS
jgi:hypothetical protein